MAELNVSLNEAEFMGQALLENQRVDGRRPFDFRKMAVKFGVGDGQAEVQLGRTRVMASVECEIVEPFPDRPTEGIVNIHAVRSQFAVRSSQPPR